MEYGFEVVLDILRSLQSFRGQFVIGYIFHIMGCIFRIVGSKFYYWLYCPYYGVIFLIASVLFLPRPGVGTEMSPLGSFRFPPLTTVETPGTANGN